MGEVLGCFRSQPCSVSIEWEIRCRGIRLWMSVRCLSSVASYSSLSLTKFEWVGFEWVFLNAGGRTLTCSSNVLWITRSILLCCGWWAAEISWIFWAARGDWESKSGLINLFVLFIILSEFPILSLKISWVFEHPWFLAILEPLMIPNGVWLLPELVLFDWEFLKIS